MKIIAEGECWSQKWSQDGADTESVSVSIRPAVLLCVHFLMLYTVALWLELGLGQV